MAALIIAKRTPAAASKLMEKLLFSAPPASPLPAAAIGGAKTASGPLAALAPGGGRRAYNRRVEAREMTTTDEDEDRSVDADRRGEYGVSRRRRRREEDAPVFFSGKFVDPFNPTRTLSQVLNMVDQFMDTPFTAPARVGSRHGGWDAREDADAVHIRVDMPGLGKEDVQVTAEQNTLVIKGEAKPDGEGERRYSTRIELAPELYKMGEIKAEMKNGVLKIVVPKVKEEERKDVVQIDVQ